MNKTTLVRIRKNHYINPGNINFVTLKGDGSVALLVAGEPFVLTAAEFDRLEPYLDYLNVKKPEIE